MCKISFSRARLVLLILSFAMVTTNAIAQNIGDYRTRYAGGFFSSPAAWQVYTSSGWANASLAPVNPFAKDMYINHYVNADIDFTLSGNMIMGSNSTLVVHAQKVFTIAASSHLALNKVTVNGPGKLVNQGFISSARPGAQIVLDPEAGIGGILENNGRIHLVDDDRVNTYNLSMNSFSKLISGPNGRIYGDGSASTNAAGVYFEIANPGGFDEALNLDGPNAYRQAHYLFNGSTDQVSGVNLPDPVFSLVISNPAVFRLSKDIALNPWQNSIFHITSNSTVDMGSHIVYSQNWGNASFILDDHATIFTGHPEGISSETMYEKIYLGSVQTNSATYSSQATYGYNGNSTQVSGNFVTSPIQNTIGNLIVDNHNGLILTKPLTVTGSIIGSENIIGNETLPVVLSSFTAVMGVKNNVYLNWTTQSETNCIGFIVYRGTEDKLSTANRASSLISAYNTSQARTYFFVDEEVNEAGYYYYWLEDISIHGESTFHGPISLLVEYGGSHGTPEIPFSTKLDKIYPNPFNPSVNISFSLAKAGDVRFEFFNSRGQVVDSITLIGQSRGNHTLTWDAGRVKLPSGIYFVRFTANGASDTRKLILSK